MTCFGTFRLFCLPKYIKFCTYNEVFQARGSMTLLDKFPCFIVAVGYTSIVMTNLRVLVVIAD